MKSLLINQQFDEFKPSFIKGEIHKNILEDETNLIQLGYAEETSYIDYHLKLPEASAWNVFPTKENPNARYKFISVEFSFSYDQTLVQRQSYSLLDWMGDMGGLADAFYILGKLLIFPISSFALKSQQMSSIFRFRENLGETKEKLRNNFYHDYFSDEPD